jgi:mannosyltransferase
VRGLLQIPRHRSSNTRSGPLASLLRFSALIKMPARKLNCSPLRSVLKIYADPAGSIVRKNALLLVILFTGVVLRLYQLGAESLWYDEAISTWAAHQSPSQILEISKDDNNFFSYYLLLHYWVGLFGDTEYSVRLPSALAGIFTIFVMYKVGCLLFGRNEALIASLILALSPLHVYYSQEARVYEIMVLLSLLSFYFLLKVIRKGDLRAQAGYVLCTSALMYSHVYGLFVVLAQNLYLATAFLISKPFGLREETLKPGLGRWIFLQVLLFVLYVPGLVLLTGWILDPKGRGWIEPPSIGVVYSDLVIYAGSPLLLMLLLVLSLLATAGLIREDATGREKLWLLLTWFLVPVALPLTVSLFSTPIYYYRYGMAASLALYLMAAKGVGVASGALASFQGARPRKPLGFGGNMAWLIAAAMLIGLSCGVLWRHFDTIDKTQWREAARYVESHARANDLVLFYPFFEMLSLGQYYFEGIPIKKEELEKTIKNDERSLRQHDRIWIVHDLDWVPREEFTYDSFFSKRSYAAVQEVGFGPYHRQCYPYHPIPCGVLHPGEGKGIDVTLYEKK